MLYAKQLQDVALLVGILLSKSEKRRYTENEATKAHFLEIVLNTKHFLPIGNIFPKLTTCLDYL